MLDEPLREIPDPSDTQAWDVEALKLRVLQNLCPAQLDDYFDPEENYKLFGWWGMEYLGFIPRGASENNQHVWRDRIHAHAKALVLACERLMQTYSGRAYHGLRKTYP